MKIEHTLTPNSQDIDYLTQGINKETSAFGNAYPFAFFIRDENGEIIAGCNGSSVYGVIYTDQLWVHPDYQKAGLGKQLMERVHEFGKAENCSMATLCTMSFQSARQFYEKLGYAVDFERPGYAGNSSCLFLKKRL